MSDHTSWRHRTGAGLGLLTAAALVCTGCTATSPTPAPAGSPSAAVSSAAVSSAAVSSAADPAATAALSTAAATLGTTSFRAKVTAGPGLTLTGLMDAPNGVGTAEVQATGTGTALTVKSVLTGKDLYVQVPGITTGDTWLHVDVARLPEGANVGLRPGQVDPVNTQKLLGATTDVQAAGPRTYRGTVDLTKVAGVAGVDKVTVDAAGAGASTVPFQAVLDEQGRLSTLRIDVQGRPVEATYSDYGTAVTVQKPTSVTEAPDSLYTSLGG
jgi:hypothetical protein